MDIIIGTMRWGQWGENLNTSEMITLIEGAISQGFTTFDSADIYGGYTTEAEFGNALQASGIARDSISIISKCGICYPSENSSYKTKFYDTSRKHIFASVEKSLKDLQTDYLDYLLIHRPDPLMNFGEIAEAVFDLQERGMVNKFGVSNFSTQEFESLESLVPIDTHQIEYSLTQPKALFDGTIQQGQLKDFPIMAWSPLGDFYSTKPSEELKISVAAFAQKYNCSENLILLAWICQNPAQIQPVVGTSRLERILELSQLSEIQLTKEEWFLLLEKSRGKRVD